MPIPLGYAARSAPRSRSRSCTRGYPFESSVERAVRLTEAIGDSVSQIGSAVSSASRHSHSQASPYRRGAYREPPPYDTEGGQVSQFRYTRRMNGEPTQRVPVPSSKARQHRVYSPPHREAGHDRSVSRGRTRLSHSVLNDPALSADGSVERVAQHQRDVREAAIRQLHAEDAARAAHDRQYRQQQNAEHVSQLREQIRRRQAEGRAPLITSPQAHADLIRATSLAMNPVLPQFEERTAKRQIVPPVPREASADRWMRRQVPSPHPENRTPRNERCYREPSTAHRSLSPNHARGAGLSPQRVPYDTYDSNPSYPQPKVFVGERSKFTYPKKAHVSHDATTRETEEASKRFCRRVHQGAYRDTHLERRPSPSRQGIRVPATYGPHQTCPW